MNEEHEAVGSYVNGKFQEYAGYPSSLGLMYRDAAIRYWTTEIGDKDTAKRFLDALAIIRAPTYDELCKWEGGSLKDPYQVLIKLHAARLKLDLHYGSVAVRMDATGMRDELRWHKARRAGFRLPRQIRMWKEYRLTEYVLSGYADVYGPGDTILLVEENSDGTFTAEVIDKSDETVDIIRVRRQDIGRPKMQFRGRRP